MSSSSSSSHSAGSASSSSQHDGSGSSSSSSDDDDNAKKRETVRRRRRGDRLSQAEIDRIENKLQEFDSNPSALMDIQNKLIKITETLPGGTNMQKADFRRMKQLDYIEQNEVIFFGAGPNAGMADDEAAKAAALPRPNSTRSMSIEEQNSALENVHLHGETFRSALEKFRASLARQNENQNPQIGATAIQSDSIDESGREAILRDPLKSQLPMFRGLHNRSPLPATQASMTALSRSYSVREYKAENHINEFSDNGEPAVQLEEDHPLSDHHFTSMIDADMDANPDAAAQEQAIDICRMMENYAKRMRMRAERLKVAITVATIERLKKDLIWLDKFHPFGCHFGCCQIDGGESLRNFGQILLGDNARAGPAAMKFLCCHDMIFFDPTTDEQLRPAKCSCYGYKKLNLLIEQQRADAEERAAAHQNNNNMMMMGGAGDGGGGGGNNNKQGNNNNNNGDDDENMMMMGGGGGGGGINNNRGNTNNNINDGAYDDDYDYEDDGNGATCPECGNTNVIDGLCRGTTTTPCFFRGYFVPVRKKMHLRFCSHAKWGNLNAMKNADGASSIKRYKCKSPGCNNSKNSVF